MERLVNAVLQDNSNDKVSENRRTDTEHVHMGEWIKSFGLQDVIVQKDAIPSNGLVRWQVLLLLRLGFVQDGLKTCHSQTPSSMFHFNTA